jgi:hypothetical protein
MSTRLKGVQMDIQKVIIIFNKFIQEKDYDSIGKMLWDYIFEYYMYNSKTLLSPVGMKHIKTLTSIIDKLFSEVVGLNPMEILGCLYQLTKDNIYFNHDDPMWEKIKKTITRCENKLRKHTTIMAIALMRRGIPKDIIGECVRIIEIELYILKVKSMIIKKVEIR